MNAQAEQEQEAYEAALRRALAVAADPDVPLTPRKASKPGKRPSAHLAIPQSPLRSRTNLMIVVRGMTAAERQEGQHAHGRSVLIVTNDDSAMRALRGKVVRAPGREV